MANYLVTGAAGFIGARTSEMLIEQGHTVTGVDNMNDAYDVRMKEYRLQHMQTFPGFTFHKLDISDKDSRLFDALDAVRRGHQPRRAGGCARQRGKSLGVR